MATRFPSPQMNWNNMSPVHISNGNQYPRPETMNSVQPSMTNGTHGQNFTSNAITPSSYVSTPGSMSSGKTKPDYMEYLNDAVGGNVVSLAHLLDVCLQKINHDFTIMIDVLPNMKPFEKKAAVTTFCWKARNYFLRFYAVTKWLSTTKKVGKCGKILKYCSDTNLVFLETSDFLFNLSTETISLTKLPCYQVQLACDILTNGDYVRLPTCLRKELCSDEIVTDRNTDEECIAEIERKLRFRFMDDKVLPMSMKNFFIENGVVTFTVPEEFELSLTLDSLYHDRGYRVLSLKILVLSYSIGEHEALVHPLQLKFIKQAVQRIIDTESEALEKFEEKQPISLNKVYLFLHDFCSQIKLEVLLTEMQNIESFCSSEPIFDVENYVEGVSLAMSYWKSPSFLYKFTFQLSPSSYFIRISHEPKLLFRGKTSFVSDTTMKKFDAEAFLAWMIRTRCLERLSIIQELLKLKFKSKLITKLPNRLDIKLLETSRSTNLNKFVLTVSVQHFSGNIQCSLKQCPQNISQSVKKDINTLMDEVTRVMNNVRRSTTADVGLEAMLVPWDVKETLINFLEKLKNVLIWATVQAYCYDVGLIQSQKTTFVVSEGEEALWEGNVKNLTVFHLPGCNDILIGVQLTTRLIHFGSMVLSDVRLQYYYVFIGLNIPNSPDIIDSKGKINSASLNNVLISVVPVDESEINEFGRGLSNLPVLQKCRSKLGSHEKLINESTCLSPILPQCIETLPNAISYVVEKLPFLRLISPLIGREFTLGKIETDFLTALKINKFPPAMDKVESLFHDCFLDAVMTYMPRSTRAMDTLLDDVYQVTIRFKDLLYSRRCDGVDKFDDNDNGVTSITLNYLVSQEAGKIVDDLAFDFRAMSKLYGFLSIWKQYEDYAETPDADPKVKQLMRNARIKSYDATAISLEYGCENGAKFEHELIISLESKLRNYNVMLCGACDTGIASNPHLAMRDSLTKTLNRRCSLSSVGSIESYRSIVDIAMNLITTLRPLAIISSMCCKVPRFLFFLGFLTNVSDFTFFVVRENVFRLIYRQTYVFYLIFSADGKVSILDIGAMVSQSLNDARKEHFRKRYDDGYNVGSEKSGDQAMSQGGSKTTSAGESSLRSLLMRPVGSTQSSQSSSFSAQTQSNVNQAAVKNSKVFIPALSWLKWSKIPLIEEFFTTAQKRVMGERAPALEVTSPTANGTNETFFYGSKYYTITMETFVETFTAKSIDPHVEGETEFALSEQPTSSLISPFERFLGSLRLFVHFPLLLSQESTKCRLVCDGTDSTPDGEPRRLVLLNDYAKFQLSVDLQNDFMRLSLIVIDHLGTSSDSAISPNHNLMEKVFPVWFQTRVAIYPYHWTRFQAMLRILSADARFFNDILKLFQANIKGGQDLVSTLDCETKLQLDTNKSDLPTTESCDVKVKPEPGTAWKWSIELCLQAPSEAFPMHFSGSQAPIVFVKNNPKTVVFVLRLIPRNILHTDGRPLSGGFHLPLMYDHGNLINQSGSSGPHIEVALKDQNITHELLANAKQMIVAYQNEHSTKDAGVTLYNLVDHLARNLNPI